MGAGHPGREQCQLVGKSGNDDLTFVSVNFRISKNGHGTNVINVQTRRPVLFKEISGGAKEQKRAERIKFENSEPAEVFLKTSE